MVTAYDGESACTKFFEGEYSLVLLDLMIPKMDGWKVMSVIREKSTVPIMIVSAKDSDSDKYAECKNSAWMDFFIIAKRLRKIVKFLLKSSKNY